MEALSLKFTASKGIDRIVDTVTIDEFIPSVNTLSDEIDNTFVLYSDFWYTITLCSSFSLDIENVIIKINDEEIQTLLDYDIIKFVNNTQPFIDCYGFVKIYIEIIFKDGSSKSFMSKNISVYALETEENTALHKMIEYIYSNNFLINEKAVKPNIQVSHSYSTSKNMELQIKILSNIVDVYRQNYPIFKTNPKTKIVTSSAIDDFEKVRFFSRDMVRYITTHPENLIDRGLSSGIKIGNKTFQPKKTMVDLKVYSTDIYENRVIVNFLKKMINYSVKLQVEIEQDINSISIRQQGIPGYIATSNIILRTMLGRLNKWHDILSEIIVQLKKLFNAYSLIFKVSNIDVLENPKSTPIFLSIPHYKKIFICIQQWFSSGDYDLSSEKTMVSFLKSSKLYEYYVLIKIINALISAGYILERSEIFDYNVPDISSEDVVNTFYFKKDGHESVLYFQPYVKSVPGVNGIHFFRNNRIVPGDKARISLNRTLYCPDFILKIAQNDNKHKYIIFDAKYSSIDTVKKHYLQNLVFKYLFSISPSSNNDEICGLVITNGKNSYDAKSKLNNVYDVEHSFLGDIYPLSEILTISEFTGETETFHNSIFTDLFKKLNI